MLQISSKVKIYINLENILVFIMYLCFLNITPCQPKFCLLYSTDLGIFVCFFSSFVKEHSFVKEIVQPMLSEFDKMDQAWPTVITVWLE